MFLELSHTKLDAYQWTKKLCCECYLLVAKFPKEEKFILTQQIKRAALSVYLNVAEGASRKSTVERKRFYEIARGSLIEIDAALDFAELQSYCDKNSLNSLGESMVKSFKIISGLINAVKN